MPIDASPSGTLDIENATLRSREIVALTSMVTGNDVIRSSNPPALEVYGDPSHGGNEARLELVSNTATVSSSAFTQLTSNAGVFSVKSGTDASDNGTITFGGFTNERMRIGSDGNVGIGTTSPLSELEIYKATGGAELLINTGDVTPPTIRLWNFDNNNYNNHAAGTPVGHINFSGNERLTGDTHTDDSRAFSYANTLYDWARISAVYVGSTSTSTSQGYVRGDLAFYTNNGDGATSNLQERMRIKHDGNVGIGTSNPSDKLHIYGSPMIQHDTYYNSGTYAWYVVGTWKATTAENEKGASLKLNFLGGVLYGSNPIGEATIYARIGNASTSRHISWKGLGETIFNDVRLRRVNSENFEYDICVNMTYFTRHTMSVECSLTDTFVKKFVSTTEPSLSDTTNVTAGKRLYHFNQTSTGGKLVFQGNHDDTVIYAGNPDNTSNNKFQGFLYGKRPGDANNASLGCVIFTNGTGRTADGGAGNLTVRSDIGNLNLGKSGKSTVVYGASHATFTGQHISWTSSGNNIEEGMIVSSVNNDYVSLNGQLKRGKDAITINESVPIVSVSNKLNDKCCFGVVSRVEEKNTSTRYDDQFTGYTGVSEKQRGDNRIVVNSLGEGGIWVVNINDSFESGDYITTSNIAGYGQKQDTDGLMNYTVAKITMDCDFSPVTQPIKIIKQELSNIYLYNNGTSIEKYYEDDFMDDDRIETEANVYYLNDNTMSTIGYEEYNKLPEDEKVVYVEKTEYIYKRSGKIYEIKKELVNVLDEHGQLQWEDDPSGATEPAYKIRYLDADGNITDEANHVYKAAFVGCTYHCG